MRKPSKNPTPCGTHPGTLRAYFFLRASLTLCLYALAALAFHLVLVTGGS